MERFQPTISAYAPLISIFESDKTELRSCGDEIITPADLILKEVIIHTGTDEVFPHIFGISIAAPSPKETSEWIQRTRLKRITKYIGLIL